MQIMEGLLFNAKKSLFHKGEKLSYFKLGHYMIIFPQK